jgi:hypothetical protein
VSRSSSPGGANPFRYGDVAVGSFFVDRADELRELETDIRSGQNVLLLSPRRFGKTSLVVEAMRLLREQGVLVAYVDLLRATTKAELASFLATALYQGLVSPVEQTFHRIAEFFGDLPIRPSITLSPNPDGTVTPSIEFGPGTPERTAEATLDQLLNLPAEIAAKRQRRVALVIDEFQSILELDAALPRRLRATFQFQAEVAHVYLGSKQHLLRRVFTDANAPLYNSAKVLLLGTIPTDRFAQFIQDRFAATKHALAPAAVEYLLSVTGGHPHDTQKLAYFVWNLAQASGRPVEIADVELALRQVLTTDTARYTELWESLTPNQRRVLQAVAHQGATEDIRSQRFREAHGLASYRSVDYALDALVERSLIERLDPQHFSVPDVFLARWLREGAHWSTDQSSPS